MIYFIRKPSVSVSLKRYTLIDLYVAEYDYSGYYYTLNNVYLITKEGLTELKDNKLSTARKLFSETVHESRITIYDKFSLTCSWFSDKDIAALVKLSLLQNLKEDTLEDIESIRKHLEKSLPKENTEILTQYKEKFAEYFI